MPMICDSQLFLFHGGMVFSMGGFSWVCVPFFCSKTEKKNAVTPKGRVFLLNHLKRKMPKM